MKKDKYLTKEEITSILKNAPKGTTAGGIIAGLRNKGYEIEGYPSDKPTNIDETSNFLGNILQSPIIEKTFDIMKKGVPALQLGENIKDIAESKSVDEIKESPLYKAADFIGVPFALRELSRPFIVGGLSARNLVTGEPVPEKVDLGLAGELRTTPGVSEVVEMGSQALPFGKGASKAIKNATGITKVVDDISTGVVKSLEKPKKWVASNLDKAARNLYQRAMKPTAIKKSGKVIVSPEEIADIGVKERIWLNDFGLKRTESKIDDFEAALEDTIKQASKDGKTVNLMNLGEAVDVKGNKIKMTIDDYKKDVLDLFENTVDVKEGKRQSKIVNKLFNDFKKKYGTEVPIQKAQELKVNSYRILKNYYDKLASGKMEGQKQLTRAIKDGIIESVDDVNDINKRLSELYKFDKALESSLGRIGNRNLLGISSRVILGTGGQSLSQRAAMAGFLELISSPSLQSGAAIGVDVLKNAIGKFGTKNKIPLWALMRELKTGAITDTALGE